MKFSKEFSTLVIVGQWNNAIFSPEWVSKFLLPDTKLNIEIPINVNGSLRFSTEELRFFILEGKLNLAIIKQDDSTYTKISDLAYSLVNYLPHTPVSAFGINFQFISNEVDKIDPLFSFSDETIISESGFNNINSQIRRSLKKGNYILNLAITKQENNYTFDLNFHFDIKTLAEFKDKFELEDLIKYKDESLKLLNDLYKIEIE